MGSQRDKHPNFFIIGCPKCGTTAMSIFLDQHPNIFFSDIKEPHYYSDIYRLFANVTDEKWYMKLFQNVMQSHQAIGEGSATYLYSDSAIKRILSRKADAKFIVMLRNPLEASLSLFSHKAVFFDKRRRESFDTFDQAWNAMKDREQGKSLPQGCIPLTYRYDEVYSYGKYLQKLYKQVNLSNVHIVVYDDFKKNNLAEAQQCYRFLGVDDHFEPNIQTYNARHQIKRTQFLKFLSMIRLNSWNILRPYYLNVKVNRIINRIYFTQQDQATASPQTLAEMRRFYHDDNRLLSDLLNRDLSFWLK